MNALLTSNRRRTRDVRDGVVAVPDKASRSLLKERDARIAALEKEVLGLRNQMSALSKEAAARSGAQQRRRGRGRQLTPFGNTVRVSYSKCSAKRKQLMSERSRMGRNASISTKAVLNALPEDTAGGSSATEAAVSRVGDMFRSPSEHVAYLKSEQFARDLLRLNRRVRTVLEEEPRCVFLQSPAYVFGDIHGNLEDLHFFSDNVWSLGMSLTAGNFVFLGDYVDRGMSCLEVVAYLLAMKLSLPQKVFLLRGNHETRDVNGWEEHYGQRSFIWQCRERFGDELGYRVWETTNATFDRLPLAAVVDQDIFCVHGGIPRPVSDPSAEGGRIRDILDVPRVAGINPPYEHEDDDRQQVASDCVWSDPASEEQERSGVDAATGYGESLRGGGAICFGHKAVTDFLRQQGFSYIMRAHEAHAEGVAVSKGARVFTVFSTSKDHNQGRDAMAGCILVDFERMQVINRSPAYRNQYVHRRDSVSLAALSEAEIAERVELGLVMGEDPQSCGAMEEDTGEDEWEDFDEDDEDSAGGGPSGFDSDDDDEYVLADGGRKSSVEPSRTAASPRDGLRGAGCATSELSSADGACGRQIDFLGAVAAFPACVPEGDEEGDADEESTVDGDGEDGDEKMGQACSGPATGTSPALRRFGLG